MSLQGEFKSPREGRFVVSLEVPNPDGAPREVTELQWELWTGAERFALGMERLSRPLPRDGATLEFELPVSPLDPLDPATLDSTTWTVGIRGYLVAGPEGRERKIPFQQVRAVPVRLVQPDDGRRPN